MARLQQDPRDERGMATAEYAVGTLGAVCVACVLIQLASHDPSWVSSIFERLADVGDWLGLTSRPRRGLL